MSKFKELKNYVKEHIPQIVGTVAGIIAVILVCVIIIILNSEVRNDSGQIETTKKQALETTIKNEETKEAVTKQTKATTKIDGTTTEETSKEEDTTEQATPTTPPRGKNGVILEELSFDRWSSEKKNFENVPVPKTYSEFKSLRNYPNAEGFIITYDFVLRNDVFHNELEFRKTTESQAISIYGQPLTSYYEENGKNIVYQYGYYANGVRDEIIYITFGFSNELDMKLVAIGIGNIDDHVLEQFMN